LRGAFLGLGPTSDARTILWAIARFNSDRPRGGPVAAGTGHRAVIVEGRERARLQSGAELEGRRGRAMGDGTWYGMLDPSVDDQPVPFSYFRNPTDVIGNLFAPLAAQVTPEGYLYTGFGELMFFTGNPPRP